MFTCSYIKFISLRLIKLMKNARVFLSYNFTQSYNSRYRDIFVSSRMSGYLILPSCKLRQKISYEKKLSQTKKIHTITIHTSSYTSTYYYYSTYKEILAPDCHMYQKKCTRQTCNNPLNYTHTRFIHHYKLLHATNLPNWLSRFENILHRVVSFNPLSESEKVD